MEAEKIGELLAHFIRHLIEDPKGTLHAVLIALLIGISFLILMFLSSVLEPKSYPVLAKPVDNPKPLTPKEKKEFKKIGYVLYLILALAVIALVFVFIKKIRE